MNSPRASASDCMNRILETLASHAFRECVMKIAKTEEPLSIEQVAWRLGMPVEVLGFWIARDHVAQTGQTAIVRNKNDEPIAVLSLAETARH